MGNYWNLNNIGHEEGIAYAKKNKEKFIACVKKSLQYTEEAGTKQVPFKYVQDWCIEEMLNENTNPDITKIMEEMQEPFKKGFKEGFKFIITTK